MLQSRLLSAAAEMGIVLSPVQGDQFAAYHEMLQTANRSFNLTRIPDDPAEAVDRNYLDCIAPIAHGWPVGARTAIDVGSGAGFPGIPLAIALPQVHFVLLDALDKRVKFLQSAVDALGLNAEAVHLRAEDAARRPEFREQFDIALARAVAPLNVLAEYLLPFVRTGGQMLALKGPDAENELTQAGAAIALLGGGTGYIEPVSIPGRDWSHRLVAVEKQSPTPEKYPRRAGMPEKKPLIAAKPC
ncbi:MAG TPA: 16S rRNA (guanine(527)-N(7))-methyltransferase RsmG [Candidatus Faecivicinus avistercoris]|nr:16S rRNA (guanine(527)-N(7))-methyltransferase RsmG [Candidatus Faecivicinus avistercoris]